ncbi:MAG: OmpH family outer membrane protein [Candidatus Cloacimonetes bacterium]|jgi:outer membrane protein|nr:OmpH family outer membrane protein [Candidatus Cloacimonadota bacterium]MDY0337899.1 OmpH family outer membrane protein [Candidatus Cloacimonadaceae bacterium]MCB5269598.1 OmpH family outer membrane protein [Candidatus Cloacimonadota bacterium]MCK9334475.1 OmpH family outer membrane protein [Candidatus Cloacimonadota bacterium]MDD2544043.1 OmpH family outer membrane protein [Candidatus Cloacimonadota bacterium]
MKKLLIVTLILIGILGLGAQNVKLGYVNTDRILIDSNEATEISRLFQLDRQNWTNQIRALDDEIQQMERDFEIRKLSVSEATKRDMQGKIDAKKAEAGQLLEQYFGEGGTAEQRYRELIDPLTKKIHDIITKIAADENYTMILDVSMGVVLYATPSIDITEQVLQELNKDTIKPTDVVTPEMDKPEAPADPFGEMKDGFQGFGDPLKPEDIKP